MSKTVDERVVSMQFDNSQFEKNVSTSMSTLDKLKKSLHLEGASKGLENINSATKNFDISPMSNGIETVKAKFSALDVIAVTALANITNSAVNAGKNLVAALTINPIKDGFAEYETQMNAVQTILANTQKEGTNVKIVNAALDELNHYADKTIYNFTEMTRNIGTFTAAGVKLDTSVSSIKGIANLAAVSGSTSQQASTAMYQLSQAIAAGTVKLMDWNSVVNAGMGGQVFQDALVRTSEHLQTGAKGAIAAEGSFRESLKTGWLTTEVLTQTLDQFSTAAETQEEYEAAVKKFIDQGYTQEEAKQMADMAKTAGEAATKVKTFSQLIDTLKEALGSGWTETWRLIIGDFEEAREMWSSVSDVLSNIINKFSDARNRLLESALGKGFGELAKKFTDISEPVKKSIDAIQDLGEIVDKVILGKFGNGKTRFDALAEAGINYYKVQNQVNEKLGNSKRYTEEQIAAQDKLLGVQSKVTEGTEEEAQETVTLTDEKKKLLKELAKLSDEQLRAKGYTDEQIEAFHELRSTAEKLGLPLNEFIDNLDQINGRWLLMNSFKNIGESILKIFSSIGKAWRETFEPMSADTLFNIIAGFHKFTESIKLTDEGADKLKRTFKGLFAILDIITTIVGGGFKMAFKVLSAVLSAFDLNILDVTAAIGDALVAFDKWLFENGAFAKSIEYIAKAIASGIKTIKEWIGAFMKLPEVQKAIEEFKKKLLELKEVGSNAIEGLKNGLMDGLKFVPDILIKIGEMILAAIKGVLGIHSPSTKMHEVGTNIIDGLVNGIKDGAGKLWKILTGIGNTIVDTLKNFDWSKIFAGGVSIVLLLMTKKLIGILDALTAPFEGFGSMMSGLGEIFEKSAKPIAKVIKNFAKIEKSFSKVLNGIAFSIKAKTIKDIAIAIAILAGSLFLLAQLDYGKLWSAVGAISALAVVLGVLSYAIGKMDSIEKGDFTTAKLSLMLISMGAAILLISAAVKKIANLNPDQAKQGFLGLAGIVVAMGLVFLAFGKLVDSKQALSIDKAGKMMTKMSIALLLMVGVVKLVSTLEWEEMGKGAAFITGFVVEMALVFAAFGKLTSGKASQSISQAGSMMIKMSVALLLMVGVCKLVGKLSPEEMIKGGMFAAAFVGFVKLLLMATKVDKNHKIAKLGTMLLSISAALLLMVGVCKLVGMLSVEEMLKGAAFAGAFLVLVWALTKITTIDDGKKTAKVAATLLAMSVAIGIMAGVCILLGLINLADLAKGIVAVGLLSAFIAMMIKATEGANDVKGNLIAMTVAIGVMAAAVAALSFIKPAKLAGATVALGILMGMFALMAKAAGTMGKAMGSLIVMTVLVALLAGVLYGLSQLPIEKTLGVAASLSMLILSLSAACVLLGAVGKLGAGAFIGIAALVTLIAAVGGLIVGIGALVTEFPKLEEFLNKGIPILEKIGYALGSFFGNIIGGFSEGITSGLPGIGENLSAFMNNAKDFFDGIKMVDEDSVNGVKNIAKIMLALTGAEFLNAISSIFGENAISDMGTKLSEFGDAVIAFSQKVSGNIDAAAVEAAANAGLMISKLYESLPKTGGWAQAIFGESMDLTTFGTQLTAFGDAIVGFSQKVAGNIDAAAVEAAANAGATIAGLYNNIPKTGGWVQAIFGEQNLSTFGTQLVAFGSAIASFSNTLSTNGGVNSALIESATNAGKTVAGLYEVIPKGGGWVQAIFGEQNLSTFGTQITAFGAAIAGFSQTVAANGGINSSAVDAAVNAGKTVAGLYDSLPKEKGAIQKIKEFFSGGGTMSMDDFGSALSGFGEAISGFYESVSGTDPAALESAVTQTRRLANLLNDMADLDASGADNFADGIKKLAESGISDFVTAFSGVDGKITSAVSQMITSFSTAIMNGRPRIAAAFTSLIASSATAISSSSTAFAIAGTTLMVRLCMGIRAGAGNISSTITMAIAQAVSVVASRQAIFAGTGLMLMTSMATGVRTGSAVVSAAIVTTVTACAASITRARANFANGGRALMVGMASGIGSGSAVVKALLTTLMTTSVTLIRSKNGQFNNAGKYLIVAFASGIRSGSAAAKTAASSAASDAASELSGRYSSFYNSGKYLVEGFAAGISANTYKAEAKAKAMAEAAASAARKALKINSPSKVFRAIAYSIPEGFAQGIDRMSWMSNKSATKMAESSAKNAVDALSTIQSVIQDDFDAKPTIRPVLDMSSVNPGTIDLGASITSLVTSPITSLSQMIADSQAAIDASNREVVSAVNGLREDIAAFAESDGQEVALYVDSKKLASSIAKPMNRQLNILSKRGAY